MTREFENNSKTRKFKKMLAFLLSAVMVMLSTQSEMLGDLGLLMTAKAEEIEPSQPKNGIGTSTDPYQITNAYELVWLSEQSNSSSVDNRGLNVILMNDIDLDGISFTPISEKSFNFNGNYKTIKNFNALNGAEYNGLLISNLGENCIIENLTVEGAVVLDSTKLSQRGIIGINNGTVRNCANKVNVTETTENAFWIGGIVGYNDESGVIENCVNYGTIKSDENENNSVVGGISGENYGKIDKCVNLGNLEVYYGAGGIVFGNNNKGIISNSANIAKIASTVHYVGGICAKSVINSENCEAKIENCYNTGEIINNYSSSAAYSGGIAAYINSLYDSSSNIIKNCYNLGTITDAAGISGGIVGAMGDYSKIIHCYHAGKINSAQYAAAIGTNNRAISGTTNSDTYNVEGVYILNENGWSNVYNTSKTAEEFASGEVAYLLSQGTDDSVWGQDLSATNSLPALNSKKVYYDESANPQYYNETITGDVSGNDITDKADAALVLRYLSGIDTLNDYQLAVADVNDDGKTDILDVIKILGLATD